MGLILKLQDLFNIQKSKHVIHHIKKLKKKHLVISVGADNTYDKIQHSLMISKMLSKLGRGGYFFLSDKEKKNLQLTLH